MCLEHVPNVPFVKQGFLGNIFDGKNVGNISVVFEKYNLNNGSQKDIRKVIETLNNGEKGIYWYIHNTLHLYRLLRLRQICLIQQL